MRIIVQRVDEAAVSVNQKIVGQIAIGYLLLVGIQKNDSQMQAEYLARKVSNLRIFEDENGKMNLSLKDVKGSILAVSQFTLAGDTSRGNRPGFETAARPEEAKAIYEYFVKCLRELGYHVETGIFQTEMKVRLVNNGPATFLLEK